MKILDSIKTLSGNQTRRPGGHNWPDLEIVVDPDQTEIEDDEIYLVQVSIWENPAVKRCRNDGGSVWLHPALATVDAPRMIEFMGKRIPLQSIEFSDSFYRRHLTVHGKVVGIWAGGP